MRVDETKRLIPDEVLETVASDTLHEQSNLLGYERRLDHLTEVLAGLLDAHCILLQKALCVHCGNDVPLKYVEKWGEYLHNGELTCLSARSMGIMGVDPERLHVKEEPDAS